MDETQVHHAFTWIDWAVVAAYLGFTTWIGHALRGKQGTIRDFFLGGRTLPWPAVTGSIISTEISALTFIGVPGLVFAAGGDFTYLQWALGSIIARFLVGYWLVPLYYEKEVFSPYDFMGNRLGDAVKKLVTVLFSAGAILGQSVRVLVTAIILKVVTGLPIELCILAIGLFAVGWTLMGGMRTVIWTDVVQFFLFVGGGILALIWVFVGVDGGWNSLREINREAKVIEFKIGEGEDAKDKSGTVFEVQTAEGATEHWVVIEKPDATKKFAGVFGKVIEEDDKTYVLVPSAAAEEGATPLPPTRVEASYHQHDKMRFWDTRWKDLRNNKLLSYTLWIALFAMPFQNFAAYGTDQLMAQRIFCCRDATDARKAVVWSSISQAITVLMMMVGAGLYAWYQQRALTPSESGLFAEDQNYVFPTWITTILPVGLSGLLIAGAFAAAISSLDSILAALSQTTLSAIYGREKFEDQQGSKKMVWQSRWMVIGWGIGLSLFAILLNLLYQMGEKDLVGLAFRMVAYTYGPMLGILLLAILPVRASKLGIMIGTILSVALAAIAMPDIFNLLKLLGWKEAAGPKFPFAFPWFFPINAAITFVFGWVFGILRNSK